VSYAQHLLLLCTRAARHFIAMLLLSLRQKLCPRVLAAAAQLLQQSSSNAAALHSWAQPSQFNSLCLLGIKQQQPAFKMHDSYGPQHQLKDQDCEGKLGAGMWQQQEQQQQQQQAAYGHFSWPFQQQQQQQQLALSG
jgi:hypothetical protein